MKGIQIKINGVWVNLPEDFSLDFEQTSFVFNEQGTFSYPFEIPIASNRELVDNIANPFGQIYLSDLDSSDAEIWFDGILLHKGIVKTDEEVELDDVLPFTFFADGSDFNDRIDKLKMQDVPLDRDIELGYVVKTATTHLTAGKKIIIWSFCLPSHIFMNYTHTNVSEPYPAKPYCNVRVCASNGLGGYKILDAHRPYSGVCFYVMYFIDCLFKHLNIPFDKSALLDERGQMKVEDFNRLAFFNTQCHVEEKGDDMDIPLSEIRADDFCGPDFTITQKVDGSLPGIPWYKGSRTMRTEEYSFTAKKVYATNKNFPDENVKDVIEDLCNAFGLRFVFDSNVGKMKVVLIRDIFRDQSLEDIKVPILETSLTQTRAQRVRLTYGVDDDTAFKYTDYSNLQEFPDYASIVAQGASVFDTRCFLDKKTGNAYRIKVNKDTGRDPSFFEVGGFGDFVSGSLSGDSEDTIKLGFSPVILNDVTKHIHNESGEIPAGGQVLAAYTDTEMLPENVFEGEIPSPSSVQGFVANIWINFPQIKARCIENYDMESGGEAPLRSYDAGYTLGIMRGPGNTAKIEYTRPDYDGEGNSSFEFVESTYAFTADSCNNHGLYYDYNGLQPGGADQDGRFSLKLTARKFDGDKPLPIGSNYENRGLVSKFLSEYLYFMARKKTISLKVDMTMSQIINIDFAKRYRIGDYVGYINKVNYTLSTDGVHDVVLEMYAL